MNIFLSWSGNTSRICASIVKEMLEDCFGESINIFMSSEDIILGTNGITAIYNSLSSSEICIAFITPMNINAPWISFEAGVIAAKSSEFVSKGHSIVIPLFLGKIDLNKFSKHPLNNFQYCDFSIDALERICETILNRIDCRDRIKFMKRINKKINQYYERISFKIACIPGDGILEPQGLAELLSNKIESVYAQGEISYFKSGFETPELYETIIKYVDKRLYVFGRKNTKLFTNTNRSFFEDLSRKTQNGFDFKCLFISPSCKYVKKAQNDQYFLEHLNDRILSAKSLIGDKLFEQTCRTYDCLRDTAVIVADNAVIYSAIRYLPNGVPKPLTHSDFYITSVNNQIGEQYLHMFNQTWNVSKAIQILPTGIV